MYMLKKSATNFAGLKTKQPQTLKLLKKKFVFCLNLFQIFKHDDDPAKTLTHTHTQFILNILYDLTSKLHTHANKNTPLKKRKEKKIKQKESKLAALGKIHTQNACKSTNTNTKNSVESYVCLELPSCAE